MIFTINKHTLVIVILLLILLFSMLVMSSTTHDKESNIAHTDQALLCVDNTLKPITVTTLEWVTISALTVYFWQDNMPSIEGDTPLLASLELLLDNPQNEAKKVSFAVVLCDETEKKVTAHFFLQQNNKQETKETNNPVMQVPLDTGEQKTIQLVSNNGVYQQTEKNRILYAILIITIGKERMVIRLPASEVQQVE